MKVVGAAFDTLSGRSAGGRLAERESPGAKTSRGPHQKCLFTGSELRGAAWPFGALEPFGYGLIMADPPWDFANYSAKGEAKGPKHHYDTMTDAEILALPVGDLAASDCLLWLWATWPKLPLALACIKSWGFVYKTGGVWDKKRWGTGYVWRNVCEPVLIATRGEPKARGRSVPNLFAEPRREHSRKPETAFEIAEAMVPGVNRCELFSRHARPGWDGWGNEFPEATEDATQGETT